MKTLLAILGLSFAIVASTSAYRGKEGNCEVVKVLDKYGSKRTAVYIDEDYGHEKADLIRCAKASLGNTKYVYFFTDRTLAEKWNPADFGPGPAHKGCIGRAYREKPGGEVMYTPIEEW